MLFNKLTLPIRRFAPCPALCFAHRSFNHPYQFGWLGKGNEEDGSKSFKDSEDLCTSSIHVRRGDIIIMATDGLFDNVDVGKIE